MILQRLKRFLKTRILRSKEKREEDRASSVETSNAPHPQDEQPTAEETYAALRRHLRRREGFGLVFVRCAPVEVAGTIERLRGDLPTKRLELLALEEAVTDVYDCIEGAFAEPEALDVVFITGLEKSLVADIRPGVGGQGDFYNEDIMPRVLGNLNLRREQFRDKLGACLVFFGPIFARKYLIRRAQDFFDWRTSVYEFPMDAEEVREVSRQTWLQGDYAKYCILTPEERKIKILQIKDLLVEPNQTPQEQEKLWFELGNVFAADLAYEEAIASYDKAIEFKPNKHQAWYNRGFALGKLGRFEEAIASWDRAIEFKPDDHEAWYNRGVALDDLGRFEEAIASYEKAIEFKPDYHEAWYNRGIALGKLGRYEEAIASFDKAIEFKPDYHEAWYNKSCAYALQTQIEPALEHLKKAIELDPEYREMAKSDRDFDPIRRDSRFQALLNP